MSTIRLSSIICALSAIFLLFPLHAHCADTLRIHDFSSEILTGRKDLPTTGFSPKKDEGKWVAFLSPKKKKLAASRNNEISNIVFSTDFKFQGEIAFVDSFQY